MPSQAAASPRRADRGILSGVRRRTIPSLTAAVLTAIVVPLAFAQSVPDYRTLIAQVRKQSVQATLGARCVPTPQGPDCPQTVPPYPLKTTGTLKQLKGGDEVTLLFKAKVGDVTWRTARINGFGKRSRPRPASPS